MSFWNSLEGQCFRSNIETNLPKIAKSLESIGKALALLAKSDPERSSDSKSSTSPKPDKEIFLTEQSLLELISGKTVYDDDGRIVLRPPKSNETVIYHITSGTVKLRTIFDTQEATEVHAKIDDDHILAVVKKAIKNNVLRFK